MLSWMKQRMEIEIENEDKIIEINCVCGAVIITPMMEQKVMIKCPVCEDELDKKSND